MCVYSIHVCIVHVNICVDAFTISHILPSTIQNNTQYAHQALTWYWRKCLINDITAGVRRQRNPQPLTSPTPEVRLLQQNGVVWSSNRHRKGTIGSPTVWVFTSWKMASKVIENHGTVIEMLQIVQVRVHEDMCAFYIQYINICIYLSLYTNRCIIIYGDLSTSTYIHIQAVHVELFVKTIYIYIYYACMSIICRFNKWLILDPPLCHPDTRTGDWTIYPCCMWLVCNIPMLT